MPFKKPHQTAIPAGIIPDAAKGKWVINPKGLNIIWGNDLRYWKTITEDSAELIQVSWLEVSGKVALRELGPVKEGDKYLVTFEIEVKDTGFGWGNTEVLVMAKIGKKGSYQYKAVKLNVPQRVGNIPSNDGLEITVGKLEDLDLHFGLYEVWSGKWKGGLVIKKAEVKKSQN